MQLRCDPCDNAVICVKVVPSCVLQRHRTHYSVIGTPSTLYHTTSTLSVESACPMNTFTLTYPEQEEQPDSHKEAVLSGQQRKITDKG